jgi:hypothetical protein
MSKNAMQLVNNGKTASVDGSGNLVTTGGTGTYTMCGAIRVYGLSTAITANVTTTPAPAGSLGRTSHATGRGKAFYSDGAKWQFEAIS